MSQRTAGAVQGDEELRATFEERAEYLSEKELLELSATMPHDAAVLAKLKGAGAKLLTGPRGSGKSTLLRRAYFDLLRGDQVLPVYVNYSRSLALEPLFHRHADALQLFRQWLLAKIVKGVGTAFSDLEHAPPAGLADLVGRSTALIEALEAGHADDPRSASLAPSSLLLLLEGWAVDTKRKRCVLLLDDAAHAFSSEQQREFFEVFRSMKSRAVAAKAAVYPGVTSYAPTFHVGHEAEVVEAWFSPEAADYLDVMRDVYDRRFSWLGGQRKGRFSPLVDYLAYASFGLPRGFLNMLSFLLAVDEDRKLRPTRARAEQAVELYAASVRSIFGSLANKLPRFSNFVSIGQELDAAMIQAVRQFNYRRDPNKKGVILGIAEPMGPELSRILEFMEYAGMVRRVGPFSRGNRGVYTRYSIHYALLLSENALNLGKEASLENETAALRRRDAHAVRHTRGETLLGEDFRARCTLNLAPCHNCGTPRASADARFCIHCGAQLAEVSVYEALLQTSISKLPLTRLKIDGLRRVGMKTVQDILLDDESRKVRSVPSVGPVWAKRIRNAAEEFVGV